MEIHPIVECNYDHDRTFKSLQGARALLRSMHIAELHRRAALLREPLWEPQRPEEKYLAFLLLKEFNKRLKEAGESQF